MECEGRRREVCGWGIFGNLRRVEQPRYRQHGIQYTWSASECQRLGRISRLEHLNDHASPHYQSGFVYILPFSRAIKESPQGSPFDAKHIRNGESHGVGGSETRICRIATRTDEAEVGQMDTIGVSGTTRPFFLSSLGCPRTGRFRFWRNRNGLI